MKKLIISPRAFCEYNKYQDSPRKVDVGHMEINKISIDSQLGKLLRFLFSQTSPMCGDHNKSS